MNNKTDIEEDIEILENIINDYKFKHSSKNITDKGTYLGLAQMKAIENILADRERLKKENEYYKLKENSRICGNYNEIEIHKLIEQTIQEDYIVKANKYDSLVEKIKEKIEMHKDFSSNLGITCSPALKERNRAIEWSIIMTLQELLDTEK